MSQPTRKEAPRRRNGSIAKATKTKAPKALAPTSKGNRLIPCSAAETEFDFEADEIVDDFADSNPAPPLPQPPQSPQPPPQNAKKKTRLSSTCHIAPASEAPPCQLFVDKYVPYTEEELAVHKNKLQDLRTWFKDAFDQQHALLRRIHKSHRLLALTGISGCGKTAAVKFLSMQLNFDIVEWVNPVHIDVDPLFDGGNSSFKLDSDSDSVMTKFTNFILSARKSNALVFDSDQDAIGAHASDRPKIILIEDLPNLSHYDTRVAFHSVLRAHVLSNSHAVFPIVLILSDTIASNLASHDDHSGFRSWERGLNLKTLVPDDVRSCPGFTRIHFNPIAPMLMTRALTAVVSRETAAGTYLRSKTAAPTRLQVEAIARASGGDVRCALNALQFSSLGVDRVSGNGRGRDISLIFYHALSKILFGKRLERNEAPDEYPGLCHQFATCSSNTPVDDIPLPPHLKHYERRKPLKSNPEHVFESSHTEAGGFIDYLAENYTSIFSDIDECVTAAEYYSISDVLSGSWKNRPIMSAYSASIACRGTMFARTNPPPKQKFGNLAKPQAIQSFHAKREFAQTADESFIRWIKTWIRSGSGNADQMQISTCYSSSAFMAEFLPHASFIALSTAWRQNRPPLVQHDKSLLQKVRTFGSGYMAAGRQRGDKLEENEVEQGSVESGEEEDSSRKATATVDHHAIIVPEYIEDDIED